MRLDVTLIKDGSVVFDYEVDAERTYDGLSFYVDEQTSSPMLNLTSVTESTQTLEVPLSKGRHTLTWLYSKDNAFTEVFEEMLYTSDMADYLTLLKLTTATAFVGARPSFILKSATQRLIFALWSRRSSVASKSNRL